MKKICFLSGDMSRKGGTERVTTIIANNLSIRKDYEVHILSVNNKSNKVAFQIEQTILTDSIFSKDNVNFKKDIISTILGIRRYIQINEIDILIDVDVILDIFSIPATRFTKTKLISWEHFHFYQNAGVRLRDYARKIAAKYSDYIITLTKQDMDNFKNNLNVKVPINYIYNPIQKENYENNYDICSKMIMTAGSLWKIKGYDYLCEVANSVLKSNPDWKWIILGEGDEREYIEKKIRNYSLQDKLILKGQVDNIEEYYKKSSIYVLTSRSEGLPMTLLEAQANHLPVVSFNIMTGPSEIISNNINGYLVDGYNVDEMAEKISELILNDNKRILFSENTKENLTKFNIHTILKKWKEILSIV